MKTHRTACVALGSTIAVAGLALVFTPETIADEPLPYNVTSPPQATAEAKPDPAGALLKALQANPVTAPYRFMIAGGGRQWVLSGRVGTKQAHDVAIRTAIAMGIPVRDDLTIDTTQAIRAAMQAGPMATPASYVYPPPLFGRLDDPFFGFEPPLVTYPPFAGQVAAREPLRTSALAALDTGGPIPADSIRLTLDPRGVATLEGRVPTLADRVAVGQKVAAVPGVSEVVNLLEVGNVAPADNANVNTGDVPPPPPQPAGQPVAPRVAPPAAPRDAQAEAGIPAGAPVIVGSDPVAKKVSDAISRRPALTNATQTRISSSDGIVTISGQAPSAYEAMLVFRAAQQTPGVREVVDKIEFPVPDVDQPNPLRTRGRPEDVEPYLLAQIRRQLGDVAHVDQVRVHGDSLEVSGTVAANNDTPRVEATLRSIPLLRGYRLVPHFTAD